MKHCRCFGNRCNCPSLPFCIVIKGFILILSVILIFNFILENSSIYYKTNNLLKPRLYFMRLSTTDLYLVQGEVYHLKLHALNKRVTFTTTNFRVASVNFHGRIYALQPGKAFVLAKVGKRTLKCRVHVIELSRSTITIKQGKSIRLSIRGTNSFVRWKSANSRVAGVTMFGQVTGKKKGSTIIYARVKGKTLKCIVKIQ